MSALLIMLTVYFGVTLAYLGTLALAARWLKYAKRGMARLTLVTALWMAVILVVFCLNMSIIDSTPSQKSAVGLASLLATCALEVTLIWRLLQTSFGRALAGWGMTIVARVIFVIGVLLGVRSPLLEAYSNTSLSMAPTILDAHAITVCPKCGGTVIYDLNQARLDPNPHSHLPHVQPILSGFCVNCGEQVEQPLNALNPLPADRFFVTKFLSPARWDVIAFHHQTEIYLKRVVALPGEEIVIDADGHITIDGKSLTPPADVPHGIFPWPSDPDGRLLPDNLFSLKPNTKLCLAADEYFVLGDNSRHSVDSRTFGPVKKTNVVGVVTWIYWPLSRMRILR